MVSFFRSLFYLVIKKIWDFAKFSNGLLNICVRKCVQDFGRVMKKSSDVPLDRVEWVLLLEFVLVVQIKSCATVPWFTLGPAFNKCHEHLPTTSSFLCIYLLVLSGTQYTWPGLIWNVTVGLTRGVPEPCQPRTDVILRRCGCRAQTREAPVVQRTLTHVLWTRRGILRVKQLSIDLTFQLTHQIL